MRTKNSKIKKQIFKINAYISAVFFIGALIIFNLISFKVFFRFDLSSKKRFTLTDKSIRFIETIKDKIEIGAFFKKTSPEYTRVKELLESYHTVNKNINYTFIDIDREPLKAKEFNNTSYNILVIRNKSNNNQERIFSINEENITNALVKLTRKNKKIIYFLSGHGERDILARDNQGLYALYSELLNKGYLVKTLYLPENKKIPEDISLLVIAGARFRLLDKEYKLIKDYISSGGRVLFLLEPPDSGFSFKDLLGEYGFLIKDNIIFDTSSTMFGNEPTIIFINTYGKHEAIKDFSAPTIFSGVREIGLKLMLPAKMNTFVIAKTGKYAFGECDYNRKPNFDPGKDSKGPLPIAVLNKIDIEVKRDEPKKDCRIVVIGDTDFCSNYYFNMYGNREFIMNIINWLAMEKDLLAISDNKGVIQVYLTGIQLRNLFFISVVIIPLITLLIGVFVFLKRKS